MSIYAAFLQGVNVGKYKRISMADLKQIVLDLGGPPPVTIANSGNVVFAYDGDLQPEPLRAALEKAITDHVGKDVPVTIRTTEELQAILANNPYPTVDDPKCLHVELLNELAPNALEGIAFGEDHLTIIGREIYLHAPNKMSGITYDAKTLYKQLGTHHTSRNWNTITKAVEIADALR